MAAGCGGSDSSSAPTTTAARATTSTILTQEARVVTLISDAQRVSDALQGQATDLATLEAACRQALSRLDDYEPGLTLGVHEQAVPAWIWSRSP